MNDHEGWNVFKVVTPDGVEFRLAFKGDTLRIRRPNWIPTEVVGTADSKEQEVIIESQ